MTFIHEKKSNEQFSVWINKILLVIVRQVDPSQTMKELA